MIMDMLEKCGNNKAETAKLLKISKKSNLDKKRIKIDKEDIFKFNSLFKDSKLSHDINYFDDEEFDVYEEENEDATNFEEKDFFFSKRMKIFVK